MRVPVAMLTSAVAVLVACGLPSEPTVIDTMGTNGQVGQVKLLNVYLEAPDGGIYRPGEDARLRLRIVNESVREDRLRTVRSAAQEARIRWDRDCDGRFETVQSLPVDDEGVVPYSTAYFIELVGLERTVRAGTTIPVSFEFRHAGKGTIDAMVEARRDGSRPASLSCGPTVSPTPSEEGEIVVSGKVVAGVEPGCLLLDTGNSRYLITGSESPLLVPGRRVTVHGTAHPGVPTTCMEGIPLEGTKVVLDG